MLPTPDGDLWEQRLVRPIDVYPEYRDREDHEGGVQTPEGFRLVSHFVEIETDDGLVGRGGPVPEQVAYIVARDLRPLLLGADPVAGEKLWDQMHRSQVHGRAGNTMLAISAVDCALWDLRPLAGAEHEYTRWGFRRFVDAQALDVLQPDIYWCGGLSETLKIAAYATAHDLVVIPHEHSAAATLHFSVTQSPIHTPYQEHLVKWNAVHQLFLRNRVDPVDGLLHAPQEPGMGMDLDTSHAGSDTVVFAAA